MPKGRRGEKRPADVVGAAVMVMKIAVGEIEEDFGADDGKDPPPRRWVPRAGLKNLDRTISGFSA